MCVYVCQVRELEEKEVQKERERLQLLSSWKHERELLERELTSAKEKVAPPLRSSSSP